jgi:tetratricopeptide (TPR) repeat protein
MLEGVRLLEKGNAEAARSELVAALRRDPANEAAKDLLGQIDADPEEVLGKEHFSYTVQSGDSLSLIAKRFLKDPFRFFILARYNEIANPSELHVGAVIKVPGKRPAAAPAPPAPPVKEEPPAPKPSPSVAPKPPAPPPKQPEGEQSAERLYQSGLRALAAKTPEKALDLFQQALKAQPRHAGAEEKIREVKPLLADQYYKKALAASRRQNLDETIRNCNKVLELDPENEKAKLLRMQALDLQERVKKIK